MGWTIRVFGFDCRRGLRIFFFTTVYRRALGPTQPPIQWVPGALSLGVKWPGREADHSPPSMAEVKECAELYLHSPNMTSWRGAQLKKGTGTTLPFILIINRQMYQSHSWGTWNSYRIVILIRFLKVKVQLSLCLTKHHVMKTFGGW
jgi:hypothetical protein